MVVGAWSGVTPHTWPSSQGETGVGMGDGQREGIHTHLDSITHPHERHPDRGLPR